MPSVRSQVVATTMETETDCPPVATITEPHFSFPKTLASLFLILIGIICCEAWLVLERTNEFAAKQNLHVGKALAVIGLSLVAGKILLQLINGDLWQNSRRNSQQNSRQNSSHALLSERLLWVLPLIAIATFGFLQAALSALLVMVASLAVGLLVFQRFNLLTTSLSLFYALLAGFGLNAYLAWALMHFPVNTGAVYLAVLTAELVIGERLLLNIAKGFLRDSFSAGTKITLGETLIIGQLLLMLPYYLTPMYGYDELLKHLYIPALVARLGFFPFDTNYTVGLDTSIIPQNIFVISYLLGGEFAVRILNASLISLSTLLVFNFLRDNFNYRAATASVALTFVTPLLLVITTLVFLDPFCLFASAITSCYALSLILKREPLERREIVCCLALMGVGVLAKLHAVITETPFALALLIRALRERGQKLATFRSFLAGTALAISTIAPLLLYNLWKTGNPLFPYYNKIFRSPYFEPENFSDNRWAAPFDFNLIHELTFNGSHHVENNDLSFGLLTYLLSLAFFLPLALPVTKGVINCSNRQLKLGYTLTLGLYAAVFLGIYGLTGPYLRYFIGALPIAVIAGALFFDSLWLMVKRSITAKIALGLACSLFLVTNFLAQFASRNISWPYPIYEAWNHDLTTPNFARQQQLRAMMVRLGERFGTDVPCAMIDVHAVYHAACDVKVNGWHFYPFFDQLRQAKTPEAVFETLFEKVGLAYIVMPKQTRDPLYTSPEFMSKVEKIDEGDIFAAYAPLKLQ